MNMPPLPLTRDLVLIGGGHTHALVLRKWGMARLPGARLTLINPGPTAPYSGMLPGYVAGHYDRAELEIDLVRLARFAGARIIPGAAIGIDRHNRLIHVEGRPQVAYDVCSVDIGITSDMPSLTGFTEHGVPAKPLGLFADRWSAFLQNPDASDVAVIGAGVAGAELAMAMAFALKERNRAPVVRLIDKDRALSALGSTARKNVLEAMSDLSIDLIENTPIVAVEPGRVELGEGRTLQAGLITGAAGARPYDWLGQTGLDLHDGFIKVAQTLQSSDPAVFAVGDCAHLTEDPRPKAGVYAVRQAPVLFDNLCASLMDTGLRNYHPQKDYLKLVSLGGKSALAERFGFSPQGPLMWRWKDHIDRRFMSRFRNLPAMSQPDLPPVHAAGIVEALGEKPMCGGCGAKVGRNALRAALTSLPATSRSDLVALPGDDAALMMTGGVRQLLTSDHLRSVTEDPVLMARIAAIHALGDIWAMGAAPQAATATIILPRLSATLQQRTLTEILEAASQVMRAAGAEIVGGHTSVGDELTIGFSVTGICPKDPITLAGGQPGDHLILTKPIGIGVILAAEMAGQAEGAQVAAAWEQMIRPQSEAARILAQAHAMTDVTGFGLAGHLQGICEASQTGASIDLDAVPVLQGALTLSEKGVRSSLFDDNRAIVPDLPRGVKPDLLFDPQTAGGLLAAVDATQADDLIEKLRAQDYPAVVIGRLTSDPRRISLAQT